MLEPITADIKIEKNDIVEIIAEPFKKEKAKVVRVDKAKGACKRKGCCCPGWQTAKKGNRYQVTAGKYCRLERSHRNAQ